MKNFLLIIPIVLTLQACVVAPRPPIIRPVMPGVVVSPIVVDNDRREHRDRGRGRKNGHRNKYEHDD